MNNIYFLFIALYLLLSDAWSADIQDRKHLFILHSYSQEYPWTKFQHDSFVATLKDDSTLSFDISTEYLDTKRMKFDEAYQLLVLEYLTKKYDGYVPDAVYVTDDNALMFFLNQHGKIFPNAPVFFSGVNDLSLMPIIDTFGYKGVYETKDIEPNLDLIRQFSPQTREIWIVGDASTTYQAIEKGIKSTLSQYPKHNFHFISSNDFDEIVPHLPSTPRAFVLLTTIGGWADRVGNNLTVNESINALKQSHPNLIMCSMEDSYVTGGVIGGFVTSGKNQGANAAELMKTYLKGTPLPNIRSVTKSPNVYMFDRDALQNSRVILSEYVSRNAIILHEEKTFFQKYHEMIVNVIFIISLLSIIAIIVIYFIFLEKRRLLDDSRYELDVLHTKYSKLKAIIASMEKNYLLGYWEWDRGAYTFKVSNGLIRTFGLDSTKNITLDVLFQHVYPHDIETLENCIESVTTTQQPSTIQHKIILDDGGMKSIEHTVISLRLNENQTSNIIVGMVSSK